MSTTVVTIMMLLIMTNMLTMGIYWVQVQVRENPLGTMGDRLDVYYKAVNSAYMILLVTMTILMKDIYCHQADPMAP